MSIPYTYEIISVDAAAKSMEIVYSSPGRQTIHIGARMPYVGETLDQIVAMYSPEAFWREQETQVVDVTVGASGSYTPPDATPTTLGTAKQIKLDEAASWRYMKEVGGITLNGVQVRTDRESQAQVTGAYASLKNGLLSSVNWKAANGQWVPLTLADIEPIATAVALHVQSCFDAEKTIGDQVAAAQNIEEVQAIVVPWSELGITPAAIPVTVA